jgi:hypothetical protein
MDFYSRPWSIWETIISREQARLCRRPQLCEVLETGDYALTRQVVDKGWHTKAGYTCGTRRSIEAGFSNGLGQPSNTGRGVDLKRRGECC